MGGGTPAFDKQPLVPPSSLADSINLPNEEAEEETDSECSDDDLDTPLEPLPTPTYSTAPGETCSDVTPRTPSGSCPSSQTLPTPPPVPFLGDNRTGSQTARLPK